ncbi:MAG: ribosomal protein [Actinobacteria bacterium]|nr:ribosomal protein [Actinomycetota bacterium]MCW3044969.1 ribosomal protein [Actinomycetota bacterium]MEA2503037.1 large subunit ribosomal protein [Actinomycetota bacterium]MEA2565031.1 large subunit ribosomal protein [Actinomycetota bacterium]MEA2593318.1 large subunit ribosomal protein [Actinomycetota bacterium]
MPKPPKGARLGSGPAHERLMLAGLAAALFREERIRTTETKARRLRPVAEKLITTAKEGTIASRRRALAVVEDRDIIHKLFSDIAPRFADRNGGYTRIIKLAPRKGDAAPMVLIEIVEGAAPETKPAEEERRRRLLRRRGRGGRSQEEAEVTAEEKATPATTTPDPEPVEESATEGGVADEEESVVDE